MSGTLATVRRNVNIKVRNLAGASNLAGRVSVDDAITSVMQVVAAQMDLGLEWLTTAITTTAGDRDYALANTFEFNKIVLLRCQETGTVLCKATPEMIERYRLGPSEVTGEPQSYALREAAPASVGHQEVTVILGPTPDAVYKYDVLYAATPITLDSDGDEIPFGEAGVRALEYLSAAQIVAVASDDSLAEAHLSRGAADEYRRQGNDALYWEKVRQARQKRSAHTPIVLRRGY